MRQPSGAAVESFSEYVTNGMPGLAIFVTYFFVTGKFDPRLSWVKLKVWKLKTYKLKYMDTQRITSNWIQELKPNEIFVFGSNLEGQHGGGAALLADRT